MRVTSAVLIVFISLGIVAQERSRDSAKTAEVQSQATPAEQHVLADVPLVRLSTRGEPIVTSQQIAPVYGEIRCDHSGGVFLLVAEDLNNPMSGPIVRLGRGGRTAMKFDLHSVPDFGGKSLFISRFALGPGGELYATATMSPSSPSDEAALYIVAFAQDGSYRWKRKLPKRFDTFRFVVLPSGDFLVSGLEVPASRDSVMTPRKAFTVIMDADGTIKRDLTSKEEREGYAVDPKLAAVTDAAVTLAEAELGRDGYVYILRPGTAPVVELWSQAGDKVRQLRLMSPIPEAKASDLQVADGSFSIHFQGPMELDSATGKKARKIEMVTYNSLSGDAIRRYDVRGIKGMAACYEGDRFTIVAPNAGRFSLTTADADR